jgi:hypothetical protein
MLIVSENYSSIDDIMNEDRYNYGRGLTADQAKAELHKESSDERLDDLVDFLYEVWVDEFAGIDRKIPLRFPEDVKGKVKVARDYAPFLKANSEFHVSGNKFTIGEIEFTFGDGSLFSDRAAAGREYENDVADDVRLLLLENAESKEDRARLSELQAQYAKLLEDKEFKKAQKIVQADPSAIDRVVKVETPKRRNSNHELWDNDFNINTDTKDIEASGKIIADVVINDKIYLSAKIESHQLSGVRCAMVFDSNTLFRQYARENRSFKDEKSFNESNLAKNIPFMNFCKLFSVSEFDMYNSLVPHNDNDRKLTIKNQSEYSSSTLGLLFRKLVGGNYWVVKRGEPVRFIGIKNLDNLRFTISNAYITKSGKSIVFNGSLNDLSAAINVRTSSGEDYPCRMFPKVEIEQLINLLAK